VRAIRIKEKNHGIEETPEEGQTSETHQAARLIPKGELCSLITGLSWRGSPIADWRPPTCSAL